MVAFTLVNVLRTCQGCQHFGVYMFVCGVFHVTSANRNDRQLRGPSFFSVGHSQFAIVSYNFFFIHDVPNTMINFSFFNATK